jgi:hypothetical protein
MASKISAEMIESLHVGKLLYFVAISVGYSITQSNYHLINFLLSYDNQLTCSLSLSLSLLFSLIAARSGNPQEKSHFNDLLTEIITCPLGNPGKFKKWLVINAALSWGISKACLCLISFNIYMYDAPIISSISMTNGHLYSKLKNVFTILNCYFEG